LEPVPRLALTALSQSLQKTVDVSPGTLPKFQREAANKKVSAGQQQQKCNTINSSQCNTHLMVLSCSGKQESALPVMAQRRPCHATYTECTFL
jgi:hypothetical protein